MTHKEVMPTENDRKHINPLAQQILDLVQPYARDNNLTLQGVLSAIGTASGALLAKAYTDLETAQSVGARLSIVAVAFAEEMHRRGMTELRRTPN